ncbi:MAG: hypothetical protein IT374_00715 [Polyangiaceae bacterium]|nr:hypothetical protein [Polyangiaceae bacterium]
MIARRLAALAVMTTIVACGGGADDAPDVSVTPGAGGAGGAGAAGIAGSSGAAGVTSAAGAAGGAASSGAAGGAGASGAAGGAGASGVAGAAGGAGASGSPAATRYPIGQVHSPLSPSVVSRAKATLASGSGRPTVFAKIGASNTVAAGFARCFATGDVKLGAHAALAPAIAHFGQTKVDADHVSFDRVTLAATVGWGAKKTLEGSPSPIEQEVAAIAPGFAVLLLGTNDTYEAGVAPFDASMSAVLDALLALGVVPIVTTLPPRRDSAAARALVPEMNAILRALAEERQVPLVDLFSVLDPMPNGGVGADGVHLPTYTDAGAHGCWLDDAGLSAGMNQRNLVTLEALDRVRRVVVGDEAPEPPSPPLAGVGTLADPLVVDALPFAHHGDTTGAPSSLSLYSCGAQDEGGGERVYRVTLPAPASLSIRVFDDATTDVDLHVLSQPSASACVARDDRALVVDAPAGDTFVVVDTFQKAGVPQAGRYRLTIVATQP